MMKDSIYTIPLSEVFEPKEGCPICRLRNILEDRCLDYIMGAAMMEPDIRIETNQAGFCFDHFQRMLKAKNRLSLALMLESHLAHVAENGLPAPQAKSGLFKKAGGVEKKRSCFVCSEVDRVLDQMLHTLLHLWEKEESFRALYGQQPVICLEHCRQLTVLAAAEMGKKAAPFIEETRRITQGYLSALQADVTHFCRMYDYRSKGQDWGNSRDSIERAVWFLTTRKPDEEK
ncbi:MAG: DUF6062 family protein [Oscillospiraceae bacterium]|nr:DUF6062 family protein [Oscillospiraceae bacterium]